MGYSPVSSCHPLADVLGEDYLTADVEVRGPGIGRHRGDTRADSANRGGRMEQQVTGALLAARTMVAICAATAMLARWFMTLRPTCREGCPVGAGLGVRHPCCHSFLR